MKSPLTSVITPIVIIGVLAAAWLGLRETDWYTSLQDTEESSDLPSDLTEVFNTAVVTRADVADTEQLEATLSYTDRVEFVHRVDPVVTTMTSTVGAGRTAQTTTATIETPGARAITDLPAIGELLTVGDILYETDTTPVYLASGDIAAWRSMGAETSGPDVAQLQTFLIDGGWDPSAQIEPDGAWSTATTTAVELWQADTDQDVTGEVSLGDIWFVAGPIRVVSLESSEGVVVPDGDPVLTYTSSGRRIEVSISQLPDGLLTATDLIARLPNGESATAALASVSGSDTGFDLVFSVELDDLSVDDYDQLPITLHWTKNEVIDQLTVPPEAIKRIDTGEYFVDVLEGDQIRRVPVEIVGQAGRIVAITGVDERATVLIP